jgi:hypothetical protein
MTSLFNFADADYGSDPGFDWLVDSILVDFVPAYVDALLWQSSEMPSDVSFSDISVETTHEIENECRDFVTSNLFDLVARDDHSTSGLDFCLTRNGHGAGFWDRGLGELGDRLTANSRPYDEQDLYVGDDGWLYI